jgi:hypothetical protein
MAAAAMVAACLVFGGLCLHKLFPWHVILPRPPPWWSRCWLSARPFRRLGGGLLQSRWQLLLPPLVHRLSSMPPTLWARLRSLQPFAVNPACAPSSVVRQPSVRCDLVLLKVSVVKNHLCVCTCVLQLKVTGVVVVFTAPPLRGGALVPGGCGCRETTSATTSAVHLPWKKEVVAPENLFHRLEGTVAGHC